ncbi:MAG: TetR/AcrR family transcriptional regulator [Candidatus Dadabacteria bacterium]|nr:MAG: TetR/AcrR family transcriptional regulator [Candidatus Dadabacteria bacterium]
MKNVISADITELINDPDLNPDSLSPKERILLSALKLFVKQGYFNTNIPDLSKESNCSIGSIYYHFKNKEEVAAALYDAGIWSFRRALEKTLASRALDKHSNALDVLREVVKFFLLFTEENPDISTYLWLSRHTEFMTGIIRHPTMIGFDNLGRTLTNVIKTGIRNGTLRNLKAHEIWPILFGIPLSYARDWLDGYNTVPPSEVADTLAESCIRALKK